MSRTSVIAAAVGLGVVICGVVQATNEPSVSAAIKPASGVVPGAIAVLFYRQAAGTRRAGTDLLKSTESDRRTDTAREMSVAVKGADQGPDKERQDGKRTGMNWNGQGPFLKDHAEHSCRFRLDEHLLNSGFRASG